MRAIGQSGSGALAQFPRSMVLLAVLLGLSGCITRTTVLINDQGKTETCKISGRIGFLSEYILQQRLQHCIDKAKSRGFHQTPATGFGSHSDPKHQEPAS